MIPNFGGFFLNFFCFYNLSFPSLYFNKKLKTKILYLKHFKSLQVISSDFKQFIKYSYNLHNLYDLHNSYNLHNLYNLHNSYVKA